MTGPTPGERQRILDRTRTVAVVGASDNPSRASYFVATYLLSTTPYEVWFVNPRVTEILGRPVYPSLAELPGVPDLVDVFRKPADLPGVLDETIAVGAARSGCSWASRTTPWPRAGRRPGSRWSWTAA